MYVSILISSGFALWANVQCHLLYGSDFEKELREILKEDDLALVLSAEHRPNCLIQLMTHSLKCLKFEDGERSLLVSTCSYCNDIIVDPTIDEEFMFAIAGRKYVTNE